MNYMKKVVLSVLSIKTIGAFAAVALMSISGSSARAADLTDFEAPAEIAAEMGLDFEALEPAQLQQSAAERGSSSLVPDPLRAELFIHVSKAVKGPGAQKMTIYRHGIEIAQWDVSTGREKWENAKSGRRYFSTTPVGYFRPQKLDKAYWSNTWQAWMKYSVFLVGGIALHATTKDHYKELGTRASGGCVRQRLENAKTVFDWISAMEVKSVARIGRDGSETGQTTRNRDVLVKIEE